ncbi:hypothetical protein K9M47_03875 [Candidatus Gracilibacteria bacterium]|nr:hypothetical protein [Candidatus Gracilibacteria bacterium]
MSFVESYLLVVFGILFYVTSLFSIIRSGGITGKVDGYVALLNAGFALMWITSQMSDELAPIVIAVIGLIYAVGFFFVYKITNVYTSFLVYGGVAVGLITTAMMLELNGRAESVMLLLMGWGVTTFTYYLSKDENITKIVTLFNIIPLFYVLKSVVAINWYISTKTGAGEVWKDFLVVIMAMVIYFIMSNYFVDKVKVLSNVSQGAGIVMLVILTWEIIHLMLGGVFATSISLLIIVTGLTLFAYYKFNDEKVIQVVAMFNVVPLLYVFNSVSMIDRATNNSVMNSEIWKDWIVVILAMIIYFSLYKYFVNKIKMLGYASFSAGTVLLIIFVWQFLHSIIPSSGFASFISILVYTLVGLFVLFQGTQEKNETKIKITRIWLGLVAARVIFYDAWNVGGSAGENTLYGVLICIIVGILLLSSAFIIKKVATE